jgi:hypothetical protein
MTAAPSFDRRSLSFALMSLGLLAACEGPGRPESPELQSFRMPSQRTPLPSVSRSIELYTATGNVHVHRSSSNALHTQLTICASDLEQAEAWARLCAITPRIDKEERIQIELDRPAEVPFAHIGADLALQLRSGQDLRLRSHSGLLDTSDYRARSLDLTTQTGSIRVGATERELRFRTRSGEIELLGAFGTARGQSETGPVDVREAKPGAELDFHTKSGLCILRLPEGLPALIEFETLSGRIAPEIPILRERRGEASRGRQGYQRWSIVIEGARIREGARPFRARIKSESGFLRLVRAAALSGDPAPSRASATASARAAPPRE